MIAIPLVADLTFCSQGGTQFVVLSRKALMLCERAIGMTNRLSEGSWVALGITASEYNDRIIPSNRRLPPKVVNYLVLCGELLLTAAAQVGLFKCANPQAAMLKLQVQFWSFSMATPKGESLPSKRCLASPCSATAPNRNPATGFGLSRLTRQRRLA